MRTIRAIGVAALLMCPTLSQAQVQAQAPITLDALQFMTGKWVGEGTSEMGRGSGYFTFESDLGGKVWIRRNHSEYPQPNGKPPAVHEDVMIVYTDGGLVRAFYTDTENHTIPYRITISDDKKSVTFLSDLQTGQPRYRLTYVRLEPGRMTVVLETAAPDHPDEFRKTVEGRVRRV
jgi:hypothetical protein